jgi:hypothetical protein
MSPCPNRKENKKAKKIYLKKKKKNHRTLKKGKTKNQKSAGLTCTASASKSTPFRIAARPSTPNLISFPENNLRAPLFDEIAIDLVSRERFREDCIMVLSSLYTILNLDQTKIRKCNNL